jgi:hypothetical protein
VRQNILSLYNHTDSAFKLFGIINSANLYTFKTFRNSFELSLEIKRLNYILILLYLTLDLSRATRLLKRNTTPCSIMLKRITFDSIPLDIQVCFNLIILAYLKNTENTLRKQTFS